MTEKVKFLLDDAVWPGYLTGAKMSLKLVVLLVNFEYYCPYYLNYK